MIPGIVAASGWTPADLYAGGKNGVWYDPSDLSTLWQDSARTIPVTSDGDPVGGMEDKSGNGFHVGQATASARPLYKTDGTLHWLAFDGSNDTLGITATDVGVATAIIAANMKSSSDWWVGILTGVSDQSTDVDYAFVRQANSGQFDSSQAVGGGLANATHFWRNQIATVNISLNSVAVYAIDGTGHAATKLSFSTGLRLGLDRGLAGRYLNGNLYGVITVGDTSADILSESDRNAAEVWLANKAGVTL